MEPYVRPDNENERSQPAGPSRVSLKAKRPGAWHRWIILIGLVVLGAVSFRPLLSAVFLNLGVLFVHRAALLPDAAGDFETAQRYLERSRDLVESTAALQNEGVLALAEGEYSTAEQSLAQAALRSPKDALVKWYQGRLYLASGRRELAVSAWRIAQAAEYFLQLGETLFLAYQMPSARENYALYVEIVPDNAYAFRRLGETYQNEGERDLALEHYESSLALDSSQDRVYYLMGSIHRDQGRYEDAIDCYNHAFELAPEDTWYPIALAQTYEMMGQLERADQWYEEARQITPESERPYYYYGVSLLRRGQVDDALEQLETALQYNRENCGVSMRYGDALAAAGRYEESVVAYTEAVRDLRNCGWEGYLLMGHAYKQLGMLAEARLAYEQVLALRPDFPPAIEALEAMQGQD